MRLPVNRNLPLAALVLLLAGCGGGGHERLSAAPAAPSTGPSGDYPMVVGAPFTIDGTTWTPADTMNSDQVGYAAIGSEGGDGISAAHRTLPLPSYVEVTALDTGKTILVRLERRGPMTNSRLVELSPGAAAQLGLSGDKSPVRVRRVNPPEQERALLRTGQRAPARMDTPRSLLAVLTRKLDVQNGNAVQLATPAPVASPTPVGVATPRPATTPKPPRVRPVRPTPPVAAATPAPDSQPAATPAPAAPGALAIQVGAFSDKARADASAAKVGGSVSHSGRFWRVRKGPFTARADAEAALAQVRAAGYGDARIQRAD